MKKWLFLLIFILFVLGNIYFFYSIYPIKALMPEAIGFLYIGGQVFVSLSFILFFFFSKRIPVYLAAILYKVGTGWLILLIYAFMATVLFDVFSLINLALLDNQVGWMRFNSIERSILLLFVVISVAVFGHLNYKKTRRVECTLLTKKEIPKDFKIVFISDVHLGYAIGKSELKRWVKFINKEKCDLLLIGGDLVDFSIQPLDHFRLDSILKELTVNYGKFACLGNHEYLAGMQKSKRFIESTGIQVLNDQSSFIEKLNVTVIGRDDLTNSKRASLEHLVEDVKKNSFIVNLDHQPYALEQSERHNIDLQLSGHTHRGQVWPISIITDKLFEKAHGYLKKGNTQYYVSSGIGIWGGRYRIGTYSEYVVLNIRKDN